MTMLQHYLTSALRSFRRQRIATAINVLGLALGLACFVAAYSAIVYLRSGDRHYANAQRTYVIAQRTSSADLGGMDTGFRTRSAPPVAKYLRADFPQLEAVARVTSLPPIATAVGDRKAFLSTAAAEPEFLQIFDFPFAAGGGVDALRRPRTALLTRDAAVRLFGSIDAVGRTLLLRNSVEVTVSGVIAELRQPSHIGNAAINTLQFEMLLSWDTHEEFARLRTGRHPDTIPEAELWGTAAHLTYVLLPSDGSLTAKTLHEQFDAFVARHVPAERRKIVAYEYRTLSMAEVWIAALDGALFSGRGMSIATVLTLLSGLILFTACINYANLAVAQSATRAREVGLRKIVGARNRSVVLQHIFEAGLLAFAALLIALAAVVTLALPLKAAAGLDLLEPLRRSVGLWIFLAGLLSVVSTLAGAYPAIVVSRLRPALAIRGKSHTTPAFIPKILVGVQFAATSLLLICVIVVYAQNREMRAAALSAAADPVLTIQNDLRTANIVFQTLQTELLASGAVKSVAAIDTRPWSGTNILALTHTRDRNAPMVAPLVYAVAGDFFTTLDLPLLAGRAFDAQRAEDEFPGRIPDALARLDAGSTYSAVIDRRLAEQLGWAQPQDAVGKVVYIPLGRLGRVDQPMRIVGVVAHRPLSLTTPSANANMFVFVRDATAFQEVLVRLTGNAVQEALPRVEAAWNRLAPTVPLVRRFIDEVFDQQYATFTLIGRLVAALTALAVIVSMMGLFGMAFFVAGRRRHEIGIRKTLGATTPRITVLLLRDFSQPVVIANVLAWPLAYFAAQAYLSAFVHRIAITPLPFIGSCAIALAVAWLAVGGQTVRAARTRPAAVLRYE
jgi:putative ABC transport system permease protein